MIIILKKYGRSIRFLMSCREKEIAMRVMTFIFAASTAASLKKHFPVLWWLWLWHGGLFREEIFPNGGFSDVQVMIFIITPRNNQSYLSLQQIFFYYHLVSHKEKTSIRTTPTNNVIQNGALMWESRVWAVFEEWNLFQVLFYFLNLFFLMNSRDIQYQNRGCFPGFGVSSSRALVQIYSHWLPESFQWELRSGVCRAGKRQLPRGNKLGAYSSANSVFRTIKRPCFLGRKSLRQGEDKLSYTMSGNTSRGS